MAAFIQYAGKLYVFIWSDRPLKPGQSWKTGAGGNTSCHYGSCESQMSNQGDSERQNAIGYVEQDMRDSC